MIDATLVEKTMGSRGTNLTASLIFFLRTFTEPRRLGKVLAPDGMIRFAPNQVRLPDVVFYPLDRLPGGVIPDQAILDTIPDLVGEVLSPSNTRAEMDRKLRESFAAGVRLVRYADPRKRQVTVYEAADRLSILDHTATLDSGTLLPGFALRVRDWLR